MHSNFFVCNILFVTSYKDFCLLLNQIIKGISLSYFFIINKNNNYVRVLSVMLPAPIRLPHEDVCLAPMKLQCYNVCTNPSIRVLSLLSIMSWNQGITKCCNGINPTLAHNRKNINKELCAHQSSERVPKFPSYGPDHYDILR